MTKSKERDLAIELAWGLIANAYGGDWNSAPKEWRKAAERWRDTYWHGPDDATPEEVAEEEKNR